MPNITDRNAVIRTTRKTGTAAQTTGATQDAQSAASTATSSTASVSSTQAADKAKSDVFLKDGALALPKETKAAPRETQLERAERFLQVLRVKSEGKLTFGGRLTIGGTDPAASLRNYYPSLKVAKELASDDAFAAGVQAFVKGTVQVPDDLKSIAFAAAGVDAAERPTGEAVAPLGTTSTHGSYNRFNSYVHQPAGQWQRFDPKETALDDAGVHVIMTSFYSNNFEPSWLQNAHDDNKPGMLRIFARGCELGISCQNLTANNLNVIAWPATPEMAAVLKRLCKAAGIDERTVGFAGATLGETKVEGKLSPSPRMEPKPGELPSRPLGTKSLGTADLQKLLTAHNPKVFQLDDAGIELLTLKQGGFYNLASQVGAVDDPAWHKALLQGWERALTLGADTQANYIGDYV